MTFGPLTFVRTDVRGKSLNGLRQIIDAAKDFPGLLWIFTGTREFFESRKGVAGLEPLHDRIRFSESGGFSSPKQPQLELKPFDAERLVTVACKLREIYPSRQPSRLFRLVDDDFIHQMTTMVSSGLRGDVGVIPRVARPKRQCFLCCPVACAIRSRACVPCISVRPGRS